MITEHHNDCFLIPLFQHINELSDKIVDLMNLIDVIFPRIVHTLILGAGYFNLRIIEHLVFRIIAMALHCDRVDEIRLIRRIIQALLDLSDENVVGRPGAKRRIVLNIHELLTRKGIKAHHGKCISPAVEISSVVMNSVRTISERMQIRRNALTVRLFEDRLVRILAKPEKLHSHPGQHLELGVRRTCSDDRHFQITGGIVIIQIVKIRNDLIAQLQKINQLRVNKRFQQNTNNVRILSVRYSLFFWNLTRCL